MLVLQCVVVPDFSLVSRLPASSSRFRQSVMSSGSCTSVVLLDNQQHQQQLLLQHSHRQPKNIKRSWHSLIDHLPGGPKKRNCPNSKSINSKPGPSQHGTYRPSIYYGFASIFGQLRLRFDRQMLTFELDTADGQSSVDLTPDARQSFQPQLEPRLVIIPWSALVRLKRRNTEAVDFIFHRLDTLPSSLAQRLIMLEATETSPTDSTANYRLSVNFAMNVASELLHEMKLLGCVRKVRYGFWKIRKCYVPTVATIGA